MYKLIELFFVCHLNVQAQSITFQPTFIDPCTGKVATTVTWSVGGNGVFYDGGPEAGTVLLQVGHYFLGVHDGFNTSLIDVEVNKRSSIKDTFYLPALKRRLGLRHYSDPMIFLEKRPKKRRIIPGPYTICDGIANGQVVDYYYNGNKRSEGIFKNGRLVDTLKQWFRNGGLKSLEFPVNQGECLMSFYKNGNRALYIDDEKEIFYYRNGLVEKNFERKPKWFGKRKRTQVYFDSLGQKTKKMVSICDAKCSGVVCSKLPQHLHKAIYYHQDKPDRLIKRGRLYTRKGKKWQFTKILTREEIHQHLFK